MAKNEKALAPFCITLPVWKGLYNVISAYLNGVTLQDMIDSSQKQSADHYII